VQKLIVSELSSMVKRTINGKRSEDKEKPTSTDKRKKAED